MPIREKEDAEKIKLRATKTYCPDMRLMRGQRASHWTFIREEEGDSCSPKMKKGTTHVLIV